MFVCLGLGDDLMICCTYLALILKIRDSGAIHLENQEISEECFFIPSVTDLRVMMRGEVVEGTVLRRNKSRKTQCYWSFFVLKRENQFVQAKASNRR